jgi:hypothetical protein
MDSLPSSLPPPSRRVEVAGVAGEAGQQLARTVSSGMCTLAIGAHEGKRGGHVGRQGHVVSATVPVPGACEARRTGRAGAVG